MLCAITRLNVGGPAIQVLLLARLLEAEGFATTLVRGVEAPTEGSMDALAARLGVEPVLLSSLGREPRPGDDVRATLALRRMIRRERPDVLHTHTAKAGTIGRFAALLSGRRRPSLVVHTFHGHVLSGYFSPARERVFTWIERMLARWTDALIAVSEEVRQDLLVRRIGRPDQVRVMLLGLDLDRFDRIATDRQAHRERMRAQLGVPQDVPLVSIVARLVPIKRVDLFLDAAGRLARERPGTWFCVAGDGELAGALRSSAAARALGGRIVWPGFVEDTPALYAASDVVALSSDNEGTPVSLIEALASGTVVVATRVGGVPSVVRDGESGLLVARGNAGALADAARRLLDDPDLRAGLAARGRRDVLGRFGVERLVQETAGLYREGLARDRGRRQTAFSRS